MSCGGRQARVSSLLRCGRRLRPSHAAYAMVCRAAAPAPATRGRPWSWRSSRARIPASLQAACAQILAIGVLFAGSLVQWRSRVRNDVLLNDEPPLVAELDQRAQHAIDVDVAFPEPAERAAPPDRLDRCSLGDD